MLEQNQLDSRNISENSKGHWWHQIVAMTSSSEGKFDMKIQKNWEKKRFFSGVSRVQKMCYDHNTHISCKANSVVISLKIPSDLDHIYIIYGVKATNRWPKIRFAQKLIFKRVSSVQTMFNDDNLHTLWKQLPWLFQVNWSFFLEVRG